MSVYSNGFILDGALEKVKSYVDLPDTGARFSDAWLVKHEISSALTDVVHRVSQWASDFAEMTFDITTVVGQKEYAIPPGIRSVTRLVDLDSNSNETGQYLPRHRDHPLGFGWRIEANELVLQSAPTSVQTFRIYYTITGDIGLCSDETTGATLASGVWTLPGSVDLGVVDRREHAYVGHILRVKPSSGPIEERIIATHVWDGSDWDLTTRTDFPDEITDGSYSFEIVPWGVSALWECVALRAALRLGTKLSMTQKDTMLLTREYQSALKTAFETHEFKQGRRNPYLHKDSITSDSYNFLPRT